MRSLRSGASEDEAPVAQAVEAAQKYHPIIKEESVAMNLTSFMVSHTLQGKNRGSHRGKNPKIRLLTRRLPLVEKAKYISLSSHYNLATCLGCQATWFAT